MACVLSRAAAVRCRDVGATRGEALQHINEVVQMIVEELREDGITIRTGPKEDVEVFADERVAITV